VSADWGSTITVNIFLSPSPPSRAGFGVMLYLVDEDDGNDLGGERFVSYADITEATAGEAAGDISAATLAAVTALFSQIPRPSGVKVARVDTGAAETYVQALAAVEALTDDWYGVAIYDRTDAIISAMAAAVETRDKLFFGQTDSADLLTSGLPAGLSTLADLERTALVYHDEDDEPADLAWAASRLVFDPDERSAGWEGQVRGVAALTTGLTSAQRGFVETNGANAGLPFSSANVYMSPGQNMAGRGIYEILSADWFKARVSEDVAFLKLSYTARGEKLQVSATGQAAILGILNGRLQQGMDAGHFLRGQTRATAETITADDLQARRLRFKVEAQIAQDARLFVFNVFLQNDPLQEA
jgi:hypothetical protein